MEAHDPKSYRYPSRKLLSELRMGAHAGDAEQLLAESQPEQTSRLGSYIPRTKNTLLFIILVLIQGCICISLEVVMIAGLNNSSGLYASFGITLWILEIAQACTVVFECLYQIFLSMDAARNKNIIQVVGVCLNNCSMTVLVAMVASNNANDLHWCKSVGWEYSLVENIEHVKNLLVGVATTVGCVTLCLSVCAWHLFSDFKW